MTKEKRVDCVYVVHPITKAQKDAIGKKIIDAKFAPKGAKIFGADGKPYKAKEVVEK